MKIRNKFLISIVFLFSFGLEAHADRTLGGGAVDLANYVGDISISGDFTAHGSSFLSTGLDMVNSQAGGGITFWNTGIRAKQSGILAVESYGTSSIVFTGAGMEPNANNAKALGASGKGWTGIRLMSPDLSTSNCTVDNSDNLTCTGD